LSVILAIPYLTFAWFVPFERSGPHGFPD
jgi:hypothetical protein